MAADNEPRADGADTDQGIPPEEGAPGEGQSPADQPEVALEDNEIPADVPEEVEIQAIAENARRKKLGIRVASGVVLGAIAAAALYFGGTNGRSILIYAVAAACFIEFIFLVIKATQNIPYRLAAILAGGTYIAIAALALTSLHLVLFLVTILAVVFADSFAYGVGTLVGGPKIWRKVSPNKTWAGLIGGMIGATLLLLIATLVAAQIMGYFDQQQLLIALIMGPILAIVAQAGDLFESWLKRKAGVKDSSRLIPGHGGFLDRFDGLIPVAIVVGVVYNIA